MKNVFLLIFAFSAILTQTSAEIPDKIHPDWKLVTYPSSMDLPTLGMDFLSDGRLVMVTSEWGGSGSWACNGGKNIPQANANVYVISGVTGEVNPDNVKVEIVAKGFSQPGGLTVVNDKVYVAERNAQYIIKTLTPSDPQDNFEKVVSWISSRDNIQPWCEQVLYHTWAFTPKYVDGHFYAPYTASPAIVVAGNGHTGKPASSEISSAFLKWDLQGNLEAIAGGLRTPNGLGINSKKEFFATDNEGFWLPSSAFHHLKEGKFYGYRQSGDGSHKHFAEDLPYQPPAAWLPHAKVSESPTEPIAFKDGPFKDHFIYGDATHPGIYRIALDDVNGEYNGMVTGFSKGFGVSAIMRLDWGPDGHLYIATRGIRTGNWPQMGPGNTDTFQPTYKITGGKENNQFEIKSMHHKKGGLELVFTHAVAENLQPSNFKLTHTEYRRIGTTYGAGEQSPQNLSPSSLKWSNDKTRIFLETPGLVKDRVIHLTMNGVKSAAGGDIWDNEAYYTLNYMSEQDFSPDAISPTSLYAKAFEEILDLKHGKNGSLHLNPNFKGHYSVELLNFKGQQVLQKPYSSGPITLNKPGPGIFLLRVKTQGEQIQKKILF